MPQGIEQTCPECKTKIKVPDSMLGKKIRCKECKHVFVVALPEKSKAITAEKKAAPIKAKPAEAKKPPPPPPPPKVQEEDDDSPGGNKNPYGVLAGGETYRCPQCATEMESEDAIVCLNCGFNTRTRIQGETRKLKDVTGNDKFLWLLPGILCVVGILFLIGYWCFHHFALPGIVYGDEWDKALDKNPTRTKALGEESLPWTTMFFHPAIELWMGLMFAFASFKLGKFAYNRLVVNPEPPEVVLK
jgi:predicted Zn finger-like uncharacterized protein